MRCHEHIDPEEAYSALSETVTLMQRRESVHHWAAARVPDQACLV